MDYLEKGTIINLDDGKNYIIADSITYNNQEYVFMITEDEPEDNVERVYVLKNINDSGNSCLGDITEEEYQNVIQLYYDVYREAGVFEDDKINYKKLYDSITNDDIIENSKKAVYNRIKIETDNKNKLKKAKEIIQGHVQLEGSLKDQVEDYKKKVDELAEYNTYLNNRIDSMPKIIRKIFLKGDDKKLLK